MDTTTKRDLRRIDATPFAAALGTVAGEPGRPPKLGFIAITELVVDMTYQREIGSTGRRNILRIAREFEWSKFAPVIVAAIAERTYAIIDGHHRVTAAALRGFAKVPCQVVEADVFEQAAAFAAVNANVTAMSPMQLHAARLAAGDERANRLAAACSQASVTILRYPVKTTNQKLGETMAVGSLYGLLDKFGEDVLVTALSCITRTRDGYPGLLRYQLISALCAVLEAEPPWCEHRRLLKAMAALDLRVLFAAKASEASGSRAGLISLLVDAISIHLETALK